MKIDTKRGILTFNSQEIDLKTLQICRALINDSLLRLKITETVRSKAQTERNKQKNLGLEIAVGLLDVLEKHSKNNIDFTCWVKKGE